MVQVIVLAVVTAMVLVISGLRCARRMVRMVTGERDFLCGLLPGPVAIRGGQPGTARVAGRLPDGAPIGLELVTDTLPLRQLPRQFLVVRFPARLPGLRVVEVTRRDALIGVCDNEFAGHLAVGGTEIGLPGDVIVRYAEADRPLPAEVVSTVNTLFRDPRMRRLSLGAHGIRFVYEVGVARADAYRITRRVEIRREPHVGAAARTAIVRAHLVLSACRNERAQEFVSE